MADVRSRIVQKSLPNRVDDHKAVDSTAGGQIMRLERFRSDCAWLFVQARSTGMILLVALGLSWLGGPTRGANPGVSSGSVQLASNISVRPAPLGSGNNCGTCHRMDKSFSHPVDVVPSAAIIIPADLPLSLDGKMTCTTCHDTDGVLGHGRKQGVSRDGLLRPALSIGSGCTACHHLSARTGSKSSSGHSLGIDRAHYTRTASARRQSMKPAFTMATIDLDIESRNCLSCHDGTVASDIGREGHQGHPVGVIMASSNPNREMPVRSANMLDPRIRLFDGRVGCNSCHNPYSGEKNQLIMSNVASRLCLSCHRN